MAIAMLVFPPGLTTASEYATVRYLKTVSMPGIIRASTPPSAIVVFAKRNPEFIARAAKSRDMRPLKYTPELAALLQQVNTEGNTLVTWTDDQIAWGEEENWDFPCVKDKKLYDDCDGIALWKMRRLMDLGVSASPLLLTGNHTETNVSHMVLVVVTDNGEYVLDNRNAKVRRADEMIVQGTVFENRPTSGDKMLDNWVEFKLTRVVPQGTYVKTESQGISFCVPKPIR